MGLYIIQTVWFKNGYLCSSYKYSKQEKYFRKSYNVGSTYNGLDDDRDWDEDKHDTNGNGKPDVGEPNVDEVDEGRLQVNDISLFPIILQLALVGSSK